MARTSYEFKRSDLVEKTVASEVEVIESKEIEKAVAKEINIPDPVNAEKVIAEAKVKDKFEMPKVKDIKVIDSVIEKKKD